jgi:hydroxypyruvate reductase
MSDAPSSTGWTDSAARGLLRNVFDAAVASADPGAAVLRHLPEKPKGRCVVIGAGKASVAMAATLDATPSLALAAAARTAAEAGLAPLILGDAIEGESRELGVMMAGIARSCRLNGFPVKPSAVLLSGGETTVTIGKGQAGRGGRNTEFLLAFAVAMAGEPDIFALAADSDGIDGTEDAAGAFATPDTLARARVANLDPRSCLAVHDSYSFFAGVGDLVRTGPTGTNVNDIRAVLITRGGQQAD